MDRTERSEDVTGEIPLEEVGEFAEQSEKRVARIFRVIEQDNVAKRELAHADWEAAHEAQAFPEPDPQEVDQSLQHLRADWAGVNHVIEWSLYRQALLQEMFCGTREYKPGTPAQKLAAHRFLEERDFPQKKTQKAA